MLSDSFLALFKPTLRDDLNTLGNGLDSLVRIIDLLKVAKLALEHESICEACEIFLGPIESAIPELELAENLIDSVYKRLEAELRQATSP